MTATRKIERPGEGLDFDTYLAASRPVLVVITGGTAGSEHLLDRPRIALGRGPDVDLALDESSLSRRHALVEYVDGGFRLRDLGSTNGTLVNGAAVETAELKHGDRIELGELMLQLVIEPRESEPKAYVVPE
ncbi:MAG: FHA domain-containing protein [Myxococcota bacterium]|nr:FHA domain-containing protein [Myxococcota bacterium]